MSKPFIASKKTSSLTWKSFSSRSDFLAKTHTYQLYFNLARPNSHKEFQTPWQIIAAAHSTLASLNSACFHGLPGLLP